MNNKKRDNGENNNENNNEGNNDNTNEGNGHDPVEEPPAEKERGKDLVIEFELPPAKRDDGPKH